MRGDGNLGEGREGRHGANGGGRIETLLGSSGLVVKVIGGGGGVRGLGKRGDWEGGGETVEGGGRPWVSGRGGEDEGWLV